MRFAGKDAAACLRPLPPLPGAAIELGWETALRAVRGSLRFGGGRGKEVHAASFIRERRIIFDQALRLDPGELSRILIHEIFHFAWVRFSNGTRAAWRNLLRDELAQGARGELGWSAESRKAAIRASATVTAGRAWSEYSCESLCDTAAWHYSVGGTHEEVTLARRFRERRSAWFRWIESDYAGGIRI